MRSGMPADKRRVSEERVDDRVDERLAELEWGQELLGQLVEEQWWCGACRELRAGWELDACERAGRMIFVCLACGEIVEAIPF